MSFTIKQDSSDIEASRAHVTEPRIASLLGKSSSAWTVGDGSNGIHARTLDRFKSILTVLREVQRIPMAAYADFTFHGSTDSASVTQLIHESERGNVLYPEPTDEPWIAALSQDLRTFQTLRAGTLLSVPLSIAYQEHAEAMYRSSLSHRMAVKQVSAGSTPPTENEVAITEVAYSMAKSRFEEAKLYMTSQGMSTVRVAPAAMSQWVAELDEAAATVLSNCIATLRKLRS